jgi:hypothetical protein
MQASAAFAAERIMGAALEPPKGGSSESVLYEFQWPTSSDGGFPRAPLIADASGALYGTTHVGGSIRSGTVFKVVP